MVSDSPLTSSSLVATAAHALSQLAERTAPEASPTSTSYVPLPERHPPLCAYSTKTIQMERPFVPSTEDAPYVRMRGWRRMQRVRGTSLPCFILSS